MIQILRDKVMYNVDYPENRLNMSFSQCILKLYKRIQQTKLAISAFKQSLLAALDFRPSQRSSSLPELVSELEP